MTERVLLIDGDILVYRNSAAIEERTILVTHLQSGRQKSFKNRTAFKDFLQEKEYPYVPEKYHIEDVQNAEHVSIAFKIIDKLVSDLNDFTWADRYEIWLGQSGHTFRHYLPLPSPYKANRGDLIKPIHLDACKSYINKKYNARTTEAILETDDMLTIRCYEELAKGNFPIMATIDKDSAQTQGVAILNFTDEKWELPVMPSVGEVFKHKTTYKGTGLKFLAYQALAGDPTDTYCPYELSAIPYGPAKAVKALASASTEKEILEVIVSEYKRMYPSPVRFTSVQKQEVVADWKMMLDMYWKCAYMKRSKDDPSDFWEFANQYGVQPE